MIRILLAGISLTGALLAALSMQPRQSRGSSYAENGPAFVSTSQTESPPPRSIVICGAQDYACVTYVITYHPPTHARRAAQREGVIDYERKTISIVWREDRFKDVEALERAVFRAALWERGSRDTDQWKIDEWVSLSEGIFASLFHDNPEFVRYLAAGHAEK